MTRRIIIAISFFFMAQAQTFAKIDYLINKLMDNISPSDTVRGVVVASPSKHNPNYYYHWVRDAALVMDVVNSLYNREQDPIKKEIYKNTLMDFTRFSKSNQEVETLAGLGEPKYYVDGRAYLEPWGRPQNDGPALRAITLIKFANTLLDNGEVELVKSLLYNSSIPATSVIKRDLEYVSHHWSEDSFDYWEEVRGYHFHTSLAQRRAMKMGAKLAYRLEDYRAAAWYFTNAKAMEQMIDSHWDGNIIRASRNISNKPSGLDVATILGVLHSSGDDNFYNYTNERVLATSVEIKKVFKEIYTINSNEKYGVAIGRYPEDTYDGLRTDSLGNPWFLATLGYAQYYTEVKKEFLRKGSIEITEVSEPFFIDLLGENVSTQVSTVSLASDNGQSIIKALDREISAFYKRVEHHRSRNGNISEQMNRENGYMQGARDLTWSYASYISALLAK
ncbi:glycoside hydrolase family 15 protein [Halobacteriovorax sp. HLS]|uniref:glycoside hydrolase family 15 protein n=1 Tax=Halobacteriovorax sp. HLS TaxID=2234000 RepID=UPI000FD6BDF2|nr:glycoside hydrolase family 15 protein [Halobacteriovorax sp. HLS]